MVSIRRSRRKKGRARDMHATTTTATASGAVRTPVYLCTRWMWPLVYRDTVYLTLPRHAACMQQLGRCYVRLALKCPARAGCILREGKPPFPAQVSQVARLFRGTRRLPQASRVLTSMTKPIICFGVRCYRRAVFTRHHAGLRTPIVSTKTDRRWWNKSRAN